METESVNRDKKLHKVVAKLPSRLNRPEIEVKTNLDLNLTLPYTYNLNKHNIIIAIICSLC